MAEGRTTRLGAAGPWQRAPDGTSSSDPPWSQPWRQETLRPRGKANCRKTLRAPQSCGPRSPHVAMATGGSGRLSPWQPERKVSGDQEPGCTSRGRSVPASPTSPASVRPHGDHVSPQGPGRPTKSSASSAPRGVGPFLRGAPRKLQARVPLLSRAGKETLAAAPRSRRAGVCTRVADDGGEGSFLLMNTLMGSDSRSGGRRFGAPGPGGRHQAASAPATLAALGPESLGQPVPRGPWAKPGLWGPWPDPAGFGVGAHSPALSEVLEAQLV